MKNVRLKAYLQHGNYLVKGWLLPGAALATVLLSEKQRTLSLSGPVAEIGVHHGRFFILLYLLTTEEERAVAIDLFSQQQLNVDGSGAGNLKIFERNLSSYADIKRLVIHEGDSTALSAEQFMQLGGRRFRLISIDGGHTQQITAHDLEASAGALLPGGILILDDCFNEAWPGVMNGVHDFFSASRAIVPFAIGSGKTFFCHPEYAAQYRETVKELDAKFTDQEFLECPVVCFDYVPKTFSAWLRKVDALRFFRRMYHRVLSRT